MSKIDNQLDLYAWFETISSDLVLNGQINQAQYELLQGHYKSHQNRLKNQRPTTVTTIQTTQTNTISSQMAEKIETYIQMLVKEGYPEEYAREYAMKNISSFE